MLINIPETAKWILPKNAQALISTNMREIITSTSSLSFFLKEVFQNTFKVEVISSSIKENPAIGNTLINIPNYTSYAPTALIREVFLKGSNLPLVYAHTIVPQVTLMAYQTLSTFGNKPIGSLLFSENKNHRQCMYLSKIKLAQVPKKLKNILKINDSLWARQSLFLLDRLYPIIITEFFLPTFEEQINCLSKLKLPQSKTL